MRLIRGLLCLVLVGVAVNNHPATGQRSQRLRTSSGPNGHKMIVIPAGEFLMGSPLNERGRSDEEVQHRVRIPRTYAVGTTEVTREQFGRFLAADPDYATRWKAAVVSRFGDPPRFLAFSRTSD